MYCPLCKAHEAEWLEGEPTNADVLEWSDEIETLFIRLLQLKEWRSYLKYVLQDSVAAMRRFAEPVGPMHSYWESIQKAEELLAKLRGFEAQG